jgi:hypothetical protein
VAIGVAAPPVYYAPAPVYYNPPPVYYRPAPPVYYAPPAYYAPPSYSYGGQQVFTPHVPPAPPYPWPPQGGAQGFGPPVRK